MKFWYGKYDIVSEKMVFYEMNMKCQLLSGCVIDGIFFINFTAFIIR